MRIAQIAPLFESVPPQKYGGTERVVYYLTEGLVAAGHDVTLFASGDSKTSAELVSTCDKSLRLNMNYDNSIIMHMIMFEEVRKRAWDFDILHFHTEFLHLPFTRHLPTFSVTTLHGRLDMPYYEDLYHEYEEFSFISISDSQRKPLPWLNWLSTIYHGLPDKFFKPASSTPEKYAVFLGRIAHDKRPDRAIEIAKRVGIPLKIAAKVDPSDQHYFKSVVKPLIDSTPHVEFIGEVNDEEKIKLLRDAFVLLFPIDWPEPFGLTMIESMACGTPVIAFRNGSTPEVVQNGVTGYLVDSIEEAVSKMQSIPLIDRLACQKECKRRFSAETALRSYIDAYEALLSHENNTQWKTLFRSTTKSI